MPQIFKYLFTKGKGVIRHRINDSQRFHPDSFFSQQVAAVLEAFFYDDTGAFQNGSGIVYNFNQAV